METPEEVEDAVESAFDDPSIEEVSEESHGNIKDVYSTTVEIDDDSQDVHVYIDVESPPSGDPVEPRMTSLAEALDFPTPRPIDHEIDGDETTFLVESIDGDNLYDTYASMSAAERRPLIRRIGEITGRIHAEFEGVVDDHGWIGLDENGDLVPSPRHSSWKEFYIDAVRSKYSILPVPLKPLVPVIERHMRKYSHLLDGPFTPVISHGDLRPENVMVDDGEVTGIIDWQNPYACHAEFGAVKIEVMFIDKHVTYLPERRMLRNEFYDAYTEHYPLPKAFQRRRRLYRLPWFIFMAGRPEEVSAFTPTTYVGINRYVWRNLKRNLNGTDEIDDSILGR